MLRIGPYGGLVLECNKERHNTTSLPATHSNEQLKLRKWGKE
jgi:hypothetical protein